MFMYQLKKREFMSIRDSRHPPGKYMSIRVKSVSGTARRIQPLLEVLAESI